MEISQRKSHTGSPRVWKSLKAAAVTPTKGEGVATAGEVYDDGTYEEDNQVTRETQTHARVVDVAQESRENPSLLRTGVSGGTRGPAKNKPSLSEQVQGKGNRSCGPMCVWESEGCKVAEKWGKDGTDPAERRRPVLNRSRAREP